jgi:sugar lactone lactonase YvrE
MAAQRFGAQRSRNTSCRRSALLFERLEERSLLAADWQNPLNRLDVNASGEVTPIDALVVINALLRHEGSYQLSAPAPGNSPPPYVDVNGNDSVEPLDVLMVINGLNADPETKRLLIQRFLVDVETGKVTINHANMASEDGSEGESLFIGSTILFNSSQLLNQAGDAGRKVLNVSLTNRSGEALGQLPNGTITGLRVRFSEFTNVGIPTDLRTTTTVTTLAGTGVAGSSDGPVATATLSNPSGVAVDRNGNVYVTDGNNRKVRKISGGNVSTVAGSGVFGSADGSGTAATFQFPYGIALNPIDNAFIVTDFNANRIRRITADGEVTTVAGTGAPGDVNGGGNVAQFRNPAGVAVDSNGTIYIAEANGHRIRKIVLTGSDPSLPSSYTVSLLAGSSASPPVSGAVDANGFNARFAFPRGVAVDDEGTVYVADSENRRIRRVSSAGEVVTIAGTGSLGSADGTGNVATFNKPQGIVVIPETKTIVISTFGGQVIRQMTLRPGASPASSTSWDVDTIAGIGTAGAGDGSGEVASFGGPIGLAVDGSHNVFFADSVNNKVRRITPTNGFFPVGNPSSSVVAEPVRLSNPDGIIPLTDPLGGSTREMPFVQYDGTLEPDDSTDTQGWSFIVPSGVTAFEFTVTVEANTRFLSPPFGISNPGPSGVGSPMNYVRTVAGRGTRGFVDGVATEARFMSADGIAIDKFGNRYVADRDNNSIRRVSPDGTVSTVAGVVGKGVGIADGIGTIAQFSGPRGVAVADDGQTLYVTDHNSHTIRRIALTPSADPTLPSSWTVSTIAGSPGTSGFAGGAGGSARFNFPYGIAVTPSGIVYVSESTGNRIRRLQQNGSDPSSSSSWHVTLVAGSVAGPDGTAGNTDGLGNSATFNFPAHIAVDQAGNIYVADSNNNRIRRIDPDTNVTTLAGSTFGYHDNVGTSAQFANPLGVAVDSAGYVYVSDTGSHRIRRISPTGVVTTVAGTGQTFPGDTDGTGVVARFFFPGGIDVDDSGSLHVVSGGTFDVEFSEEDTFPGLRIRMIERIFSVGDSSSGNGNPAA